MVQFAASVMRVSGKIRPSTCLLSYLSGGGVKSLGMLARTRPLVIKQKGLQSALKNQRGEHFAKRWTLHR